MDSSSSVWVITGSVIFFTITALPDNEAHTSFDLNALLPSNRRRTASATAPASIMAPSTIASAGSGSIAKATTRKALPDAFSSTAFTALEPISRPITVLLLPNTDTSLHDRQKTSRPDTSARRGPLSEPSSLFIGRWAGGNTAGRRDQLVRERSWSAGGPPTPGVSPA